MRKKFYKKHLSCIDEIKFLDKIIQFQNIEVIKKQNYQTLIGKFNIVDENNSLSLKPEIRIYQNPETLTYEASIKSTIFNDYYLTMSNLQNSEYYNVKVQVKPFMSWLWLSVLIMSLGGFLRLFYKR